MSRRFIPLFGLTSSSVQVGAGMSVTGSQGPLFKYDDFSMQGIAARQTSLRIFEGQRVVFLHGEDDSGRAVSQCEPSIRRCSYPFRGGFSDPKWREI